ncbi:BA14K family protein [Consotaella sp. CSK11QG-6]
MAASTLASGLVAASPAAAQSRDRERYVEQYCSRHSNDRDCRDFHRGHNNWDNDRYQRWYRDHHDGKDAAAAAIFGLAAGAIAGGVVAGATRDRTPPPRGRGMPEASGHQQACAQKYRSYDYRSDTYMGYDGQRHRCNL